MAGRQPDYSVSIQAADGAKWISVGAAWINDSGTLSIQINDYIQLPVGPCKLTLFPKDYKPKAQQVPAPKKTNYTSASQLADELDKPPV